MDSLKEISWQSQHFLLLFQLYQYEKIFKRWECVLNFVLLLIFVFVYITFCNKIPKYRLSETRQKSIIFSIIIGTHSSAINQNTTIMLFCTKQKKKPTFVGHLLDFQKTFCQKLIHHRSNSMSYNSEINGARYKQTKYLFIICMPKKKKFFLLLFSFQILFRPFSKQVHSSYDQQKIMRIEILNGKKFDKYPFIEYFRVYI